jgi:hypothetical protein
MTLFQSSPVDRAKTRRKPFWNVVKFFRGPMTSPSVMVWKRNQPMMVNMK